MSTISNFQERLNSSLQLAQRQLITAHEAFTAMLNYARCLQDNNLMKQDDIDRLLTEFADNLFKN